MKKIAIITPGHLPVPAVNGGAVETLITYLIELNEVEKKYDIDLYTIDDNRLNDVKYKNTKMIRIKNHIVFRAIFKVINYLLAFFNVNKSVNYFGKKVVMHMNKNNIEYDTLLIENNMIIYGEVAAHYNYFFKSKKIFHLHNVIYAKDEKYYNHLFKLIANTCDCVLAVSNYMKNYFQLKTNMKNIDILYNVIDFSEYVSGNYLSKIESREKNNIDNNSFNFIFTGRCVEDKGVLELVNAFNRLYKKYHWITLSICGMHLDNPSSFEKKIINISNSNSAIKTFNYTNKRTLINIISSSDCVVIPSKCDEAFGVVALEAMALGKAIISSNSGGLVEPLNSDCSIIIDRENIEKELFLAMDKIVSDSKLAHDLSENAYQRVNNSKDFNKKYYLENFISITKEK